MQIELDIGIGPQGAMRRGEALGCGLTLSRDDRPLTMLALVYRKARAPQR